MGLVVGDIATGRQHRVFGPPGTGKTTYLGKQIVRAAEKFGGNEVMVTSFSRAAAQELNDRNTTIPADRIRTLHSHCWHALGCPPIADTKANEWNAIYPQYRIGRRRKEDLEGSPEDRAGDNNPGGELLRAASIQRSRSDGPVEIWIRPEVAKFVGLWERWKKENGYLDFTDILERALYDIRVAPGCPSVIFGDEAQDFTPLQLRLLRKWGGNCEYFILVGDDDQTIYGFTGATPDAFLRDTPGPNEKTVLSQSFRVPQAVHAISTRWIRQVGRREDKVYKPTAAPGSVEFSEASAQCPEALVYDAEREISRGRSVMFLASCAYMLGPLTAVLRTHGIPYHNSYRPESAAWNPLAPNPRGVTAADRVRALLTPIESSNGRTRAWTGREFLSFAKWMAADGVFTRGAKKTFDRLPEEQSVTPADLQAWFTPEQYNALMPILMYGSSDALLSWWYARLLASHKDAAAYPGQVVIKRSLDALAARPLVTIGTIHSVKGGEADTVYLFNDLSRAGTEEWCDDGSEGHDSIVRQVYVAMTRSRDRLVIANNRRGVMQIR